MFIDLQGSIGACSAPTVPKQEINKTPTLFCRDVGELSLFETFFVVRLTQSPKKYVSVDCKLQLQIPFCGECNLQ